MLFLDEDFERVQVFLPDGTCEGTWVVCPRCTDTLNSVPPRQRRIYPVGSRIPQGIALCGICRMALRHGEMPHKLVRLAPEDVAGTDLAHGCYVTCETCRQHWGRIVHARLRAAGEPSTPPVFEMINNELIG
jgi:hypothetical protein